MAKQFVGADFARGNVSNLIKPPMPAVSQILSRFNRAQLEGFIAVAIDLADAMDGDSDVEDEDCDLEDGGDAEQASWSNSPSQLGLAAHAMAWHHDDAEDDDPDHEHDGCEYEDGF